MTRSLRHNNLLQMKRHPSLRVVYDLRARAWKTDKVKLNDFISYSVWIYTFLLIRSSKRRAHHSSRSESWNGATKSFSGIWPQRRQNEVESGRKRKQSSQRSETKYLRTGLELHPKMRGGDERIPICIFSVKLGKDTFLCHNIFNFPGTNTDAKGLQGVTWVTLNVFGKLSTSNSNIMWIFKWHCMGSPWSRWTLLCISPCNKTLADSKAKRGQIEVTESACLFISL